MSFYGNTVLASSVTEASLGTNYEESFYSAYYALESLIENADMYAFVEASDSEAKPKFDIKAKLDTIIKTVKEMFTKFVNNIQELIQKAIKSIEEWQAKHNISRGLLKVALGNFNYNEIKRANEAIMKEKLSNADIAKIIYGKVVDVAGKLGAKVDEEKLSKDMIDDNHGGKMIGYLEFDSDATWGAKWLNGTVKDYIDKAIEPVIKSINDKIDSIKDCDSQAQAKTISDEVNGILKDLNSKTKRTFKDHDVDPYSSSQGGDNLFKFKEGFIFSEYTFNRSVEVIENLKANTIELKKSWVMKSAKDRIDNCKNRIETLKKLQYKQRLYTYRKNEEENADNEYKIEYTKFGESNQGRLLQARLDLSVAQFNLKIATLATTQAIRTARVCAIISFGNLMKIKNDTRKINDWYDKKLKGKLKED